MSLTDMAAPFSTVVSLIGMFKSGRDAAQGQDYLEFMAWLIESGHKELKDLIEMNHATTIGIKAVLNQQNDQLAETLARIDSALASFASTMQGFSSITEGLRPSSTISPQALNILRQFEALGAASAIEMRVLGGTMIHAANGGRFDYDDPQFLDDDLRTLLDLKLLNLDHNNQGNRVFRYTRAASDLVKRSAK